MKNKNQVKPIYVVYGGEGFLRLKEIERVVGFVLDGRDAQLAVYEVEGDKADVASVLDELRTLPFLSDRRIAIVRNADKFLSASSGNGRGKKPDTPVRKVLEGYLESPCATGVLVLELNSFPRTLRLRKQTEKIGEVIECAPVKDRQAPNWLIRHAQTEYQKQLDHSAAELLVELVGADLGLLDGELGKLALYAGESSAITPGHIEELVGHNRSYTIFQIIEAMGRRQADKALEQLNQMLTADRSSEYTAVGGLAWHLRRLRQARALLDEGMSGDQVCRQLNIRFYREQFIGQVNQLSLPRIRRAARLLARADYATKTGLGAVRTALEKFIVQMCRR